MFSVFKAANHIGLIQDQEEVRKKYRYWRLRIFFGMYLGYAFFYLTRKSLTFVLPALMIEFQWTKADVGIFGSILYIAYGLSKFLSGIIGDRSNPRFFMAIGLMATGLLNIFFGLSSSLMFFCLFWGLNGLFQGWGWPPCARLLTHWYARSERGGWWGIWNTSHNVGGGLSILMGPLIATLFGWRMAMYVPGVICLLGGVYLAITLRDTPQSLGLPPIEEHKNEAVSGSEEDRERELSTKEILFKYVLANKFLWILAFGYFFIYAIRTAINDWGQLYLMEQKGHSLISAGGAIFWFEIGGLFGSVIAGLISDRLFASRRGPVNVLFSLFVTFALGLLWIIPNSNYLVASVSIFFIGFLIFGPQMLIGMAAAELSHKKAAGTATGFAGWFGYFGAAFSAYPFGVIATKWGWGGFFLVLGACACISVLILLPLWSVRSRDEIISTEGKVA